MNISCTVPGLRWRASMSTMMAALLLAACGPNLTKADNYEALADNLQTAKAYPAALGALEKSISYDSNEPRRWLKLARLQREMDMPALAATSYQRALDLDPANVESLQNLAILLVRAGRYDEAKTYVEPLLVLSPNDVAGTLALGAIALFEKRYTKAGQIADQLIDLAPDSLGGYSLKAHVLEATGRPAEGARILAQRLVLDPDNTDVALQLMGLYRKSGDRQGIRNTALILAKLVPDDPRYQLEAARALHAQGQDASANAILSALQQRYRGNPSVIVAIAEYWGSTLPPRAALARIVAMAEASAGRTKAALTNALVAMGRVDLALRLLQPLAGKPVTSDSVDIEAAYASALMASGRAAEARQRADAVLAFDGSNDAALLVRARDSFNRKDYAHALTDAQVVMSDDATNEGAALLVPAIYAAMGNKALVAKAYGDAQHALPHSQAINRAQTQWLIANGRAADGLQLAAVFARTHPDSRDALQVYAAACVASKDPHCGKLIPAAPDEVVDEDE